MINFTSPQLPRPKAIIFDWDNTLVDSWDIIHESMNTTLSTHGMTTWTLEETRNRTRKSMRDSFPVLFGENWREAANVFYSRYKEIHLECLNPLPHSEEMLIALKDYGIFMAVVSNKIGIYLRLEAKHLGWDQYLTNLIGANDAICDKPAIDPVNLALMNSGYSLGEDIWFVGDTDIDLECAVRAGCTPILVRKANEKSGEFTNYPPAKHLKNCWEVKEYVKKFFD